MIPLPSWMKDGFKNSACPYCHAPCKASGVYGVGIREENTPQGTIKTFCYEYKCVDCNKRSVFTGFPTSYEEYISDLIEIAEVSGEDPKEEMRNEKSEMTDKEVKQLYKMMNDTEYYEDFLDKLGILDQYPEFRFKKGTDENK